jgi:thiosulfate/3-mercaptopyruvate sulfurtransferase
MDALVSTKWLAGQPASPDLRIFDCTVFIRPSTDRPFTVESGRSAWEEGHIPGSGFLDLVDQLSDTDAPLPFTAPDPERLAAAFGEAGVGPGTRVVLYDRSANMWATRAWWLLRSIGFDSAAVLDGGWQAWTTDGRAVSTDQAPVCRPVELRAEPRPEALASKDEVEAATTDDRVCLVNALSAEIHDGTDATYGRPGRIPSSVNVYFRHLVDPETHRYRPLDELRTMFSEAGVTPGRIVTWCGGGIAATSDAFVLTLLGHDDVAIYDGSLSEWLAAGLPTETGSSAGRWTQAD